MSEWVLDILVEALPQLKLALVIQRYENGAAQIHSTDEQYNGNVSSTLDTFLQTATQGWYSKDETALAYKKKLGQISLEGELNRDFLFVKNLKFKEGSLALLLQFSPFVLSPNNYLNASEKKVLEQCISGLLRSLIQSQQEDVRILKQIARSSESLRNEVADLSKALENKNLYFESTIKQLLKLLFGKLEQQLGQKVRYTPAFTKAVVKFNGDYEALEKHLEQQVMIEGNLAQLNGESEIWLDEIHLKNLRSKTIQSSPKHNLPMQMGRFTKANNLLDKYEQAAEIAIEKGMSIIGKNIGAQCNPPISNAAITDALGKNARKIYELFERYPNRWPIIRSEFKSVANIIEKENRRRQVS